MSSSTGRSRGYRSGSDTLGPGGGRSQAPAAASLWEGLREMFTINPLELPSPLRGCLDSTNVIELSKSGVRNRTRRIKNWQDAGMVIRWIAASLLDMEKRFRRIMGHQPLWILEAHLDELVQDKKVAWKGNVA